MSETTEFSDLTQKSTEGFKKLFITLHFFVFFGENNITTVINRMTVTRVYKSFKIPLQSGYPSALLSSPDFFILQFIIFSFLGIHPSMNKDTRNRKY